MVRHGPGRESRSGVLDQPDVAVAVDKVEVAVVVLAERADVRAGVVQQDWCLGVGPAASRPQIRPEQKSPNR
jgi:hypothetical protein